MDQRTKRLKAQDPRYGQFEYLGRWVDKENFRAWVLDKKGNKKLANSYQEFQTLTESGLWFSSKEDADKAKQEVKKGDQKDGPTISNS